MAEQTKVKRPRVWALYANPDTLEVKFDGKAWWQDDWARKPLEKIIVEQGNHEFLYQFNDLYVLSYSKKALKRRAAELIGEWLSKAEERCSKIKKLQEEWGRKV